MWNRNLSIFFLPQDVALYSLKGSTAANLSHLLQEKEKTISLLNKTLEEKERDKLAQQEELADLRRSAIIFFMSGCRYYKSEGLWEGGGLTVVIGNVHLHLYCVGNLNMLHNIILLLSMSLVVVISKYTYSDSLGRWMIFSFCWRSKG